MQSTLPRIVDQPRRAFTIVEVMVAIGIITVLLALLLPALGVARRNSQWAGSQNNLRQIHALMSAYSGDNRDYIVPSEFDYNAAQYPGKVRSASPAGVNPLLGQPSTGSWSDILWTYGELGPLLLPDDDGAADAYDYRYDSPDRFVFERLDDYKSPFRSMVANSYNAKTPSTPEALPFGDGAEEVGEPGYFAANQFFDSTIAGNWFTAGQIRRPTLSVYLVDSFHGEVIPATDDAWSGLPQSNNAAVGQVDFRYVGDTALLLMLDGRIVTQPRWDDLTELRDDFQIRVLGLDSDS